MINMPSRIWGPLIVITIFTLLGAVIGTDIALWPWDESVSLPLFLFLGIAVGLIAGVGIVWRIRQAEDLTLHITGRTR
jgi:hypothetical protein